MTRPTFEMKIQAIAPDYELCMVTIRDQYRVESRWMLPTGKLSDEEIEKLFEAHKHASQAQTGRN